MDGAKAEIPCEPHRPEIVREQSVQRVGDESERRVVEPPPPFVARQNGAAADIEPEPMRVDQDLGKRGGITDAEIQALSGDRMNDVRRITHEGKTLVDVAFGVHRRERIRPARPCRPYLA